MNDDELAEWGQVPFDLYMLVCLFLTWVDTLPTLPLGEMGSKLNRR